MSSFFSARGEKNGKEAGNGGVGPGGGPGGWTAAVFRGGALPESIGEQGKMRKSKRNRLETKKLLPLTFEIKVIMIEKKKTDNSSADKRSGASLVYAMFSAVFAALTSIFGKIGIENVESNLGTAIRTVVVLLMAWILVFAEKKQSEIKNIDKKSWLFLALSGFTTGGSWLCYYGALKNGPASIIAPIDKLSIVVTVAFSYIILKEKLSKKAFLGLVLIVAGTLSLLIKY